MKIQPEKISRYITDGGVSVALPDGLPEEAYRSLRKEGLAELREYLQETHHMKLDYLVETAEGVFERESASPLGEKKYRRLADGEDIFAPQIERVSRVMRVREEASWTASFYVAGEEYLASLLFSFENRAWETGGFVCKADKSKPCPFCGELCVAEQLNECAHLSHRQILSFVFLPRILSDPLLQEAVKSPDNPYRVQMALKGAFKRFRRSE